ncbi:anthrone oxygenase family protein [Thalassobius sp. S69A]|uniref:anthrone oxygenase family protein n=1 Tax=unclassified Thalassovita TaxID=2619711 RepID=UPI003C7D015F
MGRLLMPMSMLSLLSIGAIFGFFYAWVCSTMWGLDMADSGVAITAMQAMNASVRNPVFFPAFFLTPVILALTGGLALRLGRRRAGVLFLMGGGLYFGGALLVTVMVNVPMNEALALVELPADELAAAEVWQAYSTPWQFWNMLRTIASGGALILTGLAIYGLNPEKG